MLCCSSSAGIIVPETLHNGIPQGPITRDQHLFRHPNPHLIEDEIAAAEISQIEIGRLIDGCRVFLKPIQEHGTCVQVPLSAASTAPRIGFPYVDGRLKPLTVSCHQFGIGSKVAQVIDGVNTRTLKRLGWQMFRLLLLQCVRSVCGEMSLVERIVRRDFPHLPLITAHVRT